MKNNKNMKSSNKMQKTNVTNKNSNNVNDSCKSNVTNKQQSSSKSNIGFENESHSFELDENDDHSFELR